jgi:hypothetical protein
MAILIHFLLMYDHKQAKLVDQKRFRDPGEALAAYAEWEEEHRWDPNLEIVLVGADSLETIMRTHGHYFERPAQVIGIPIPVN